MSRIASAIRPLYNRVLRPHLPRKLAVCNGVTARAVRLFDFTDIIPDYESALITGIRENVQSGDEVVVVGGGYGVSSVIVAKNVGSGSVLCFEGAAAHIEIIEETLDINDASDSVTVRHAIVGENPELYQSANGAETLAVSELPECDVLVLDCEGTEREILTNLQIRPRSIVVETHGQFGSPTALIEDLLVDENYSIQSEEWLDNEMAVLTARREEN